MFDKMKKPLEKKILLCIHPEGWHAWIEPGGEPLIRSSFIRVFFLGNASNGGMKGPVGLIQVTTVTRDPRSAD